jgi:hypothetical protein
MRLAATTQEPCCEKLELRGCQSCLASPLSACVHYSGRRPRQASCVTAALLGAFSCELACRCTCVFVSSLALLLRKFFNVS